jgi:hypothetical protein
MIHCMISLYRKMKKALVNISSRPFCAFLDMVEFRILGSSGTLDTTRRQHERGAI